jgi:hypothetical protein
VTAPWVAKAVDGLWVEHDQIIRDGPIVVTIEQDPGEAIPATTVEVDVDLALHSIFET